MIDMADPGALADGRVRAGYNQTADGDLDNRPRDLDQDETGAVAAAAFAKRAGWAKDLPPPEPDTPQESASDAASDWSTDRLERYFALREAENHPQDEPRNNRDSEMRKITSGTPFASFDDE
jgi:hypothetical protein